MPQIIKDLLSSKKAIAAIVGVLMVLIGRFGLDVDPELVTQVVSLVVAYIVGQGIADNGKAAATITAASKE